MYCLAQFTFATLSSFFFFRSVFYRPHSSSLTLSIILVEEIHTKLYINLFIRFVFPSFHPILLCPFSCSGYFMVDNIFVTDKMTLFEPPDQIRLSLLALGFFLISELFIHRMFRSRFLLFIRSFYAVHVRDSIFGSHHFLLFLYVSCGPFRCLMFTPPVSWSYAQWNEARKKQTNERQKQYFQFIFSCSLIFRFTKLSLIFYWIGYWSPFLFQLTIMSRQSESNLCLCLALSVRRVSQLFSNQTFVWFIYLPHSLPISPIPPPN